MFSNIWDVDKWMSRLVQPCAPAKRSGMIHVALHHGLRIPSQDVAQGPQCVDGSQKLQTAQLEKNGLGWIKKLAAITLPETCAPNKSGGGWARVEPVEPDDILQFGESSKLQESMG